MSTTTATTDPRERQHGAESRAARTAHPPQPPSIDVEAVRKRSARAALPDRVAMRIGLALLLWGTRASRAAEALDEAVRRREARAFLLERALDERRQELDRARAAAGLTMYQGPFGR